MILNILRNLKLDAIDPLKESWKRGKENQIFIEYSVMVMVMGGGVRTGYKRSIMQGYVIALSENH